MLKKNPLPQIPDAMADDLHPVDFSKAFEPGEGLDQRERVNYYIACLKDAPNYENTDKFIRFITSPAAQKIYDRFGFTPHN